MTEIKVGDRVTWRPRYRDKKTPEIMTGRVISVHGGRQPLDDQAREDAIAALRVPSVIAAVVDDYAEVMQREAGNLGNVEL